MDWNRFRQQPIKPTPKQNPEGCKMKVRRDAHGRVVGYSDNGKCSKNQINSFAEKSGIGEDSDEED